MKKLLLLFLLSSSISFGQTTLANKLRITGNVTDNVATKINVQDALGNVNTIAKTDLQDVLNFATESAFPTTGILNKIYVATSSPTKLYRWNGTVYVEAGGSPTPTLQQVLTAGSGSNISMQLNVASQIAVSGFSNDNVGVYGSSNDNVGVYGSSTNNVALRADINNNNTNNIAEFRKNNINQTTISHDGIVTGNGFKLPVGSPNHFFKTNGTIDTNIYETASNKATTLTPSATLYPNNNAVIEGLSGKISGSGTNGFLPQFGANGILENSSVRLVGASMSFPSGGDFNFGSSASSRLRFITANNASYIQHALGNVTGGRSDLIFTGLFGESESFRIKGDTGNFLIGTSTDLGHKLQVEGNISATTNNGTPNEVVRNVDIAGKENLSNKATTLTPSATLYPNNNAVIAYVSANSGSSNPVSATQPGIVDNVALQELGGVDKLINGVRIGIGGGSQFANTANGVNALQNNTTGNYNTANGYMALSFNTSGYYNTANGYMALRSNTTGYYNTANGTSALSSNTTGEDNIGIGTSSGESITTGYNNTYIGRGTSLGNTSNTLVLSTGVTNRIIVNANGKTNLLAMLNIVDVPAFSTAVLANQSTLETGDVYQINGVLMIIQPK